MTRFLVCAVLVLAGCDDGGGGMGIVVLIDGAVTDSSVAADAMAPSPDMGVPVGDMSVPAPDRGAPPEASTPGSACGCDADCAAVGGQAGICVVGVCMVEPSSACGGGEVEGCPDGFQCWGFEGGNGPFCWPDCDAFPGCAGTCDGDGSCAPDDGTECDAGCSSYCGGGAPTGDVGGPCGGDADCGGSTCYAAEGWVNGYCLDFGCGAAGSECGEGGVCVSGLADDNICMAGCEGPEDCRTGYQCSRTNDGNVCFAGCADDDGCPGGFTCNADEVCVADLRCSPARPENGTCPPGEICTGGECVPFACEPDSPLEPNDARADARAVDGPVEGLQICADDHDWYRFTPSNADVIYTLGQHSQYGSGNLDVTLVDGDGDVHEQGWLLPDGYHEENGVGPMDLEGVSLVGHPDAAEFSLHVWGQGGATNDYDLHFQEIPYVDGPDCEAAGYTEQQCKGLTPQGRLDTSQYIIFPAGHAADPYIGNGVFFDSGLSRSNTPSYVPSSARWARREMVMAIRHAVHVVQTTYPGTTPLGIGEISMRDGTTPAGHPNGTHFYGANVDLAYYIREENQRQWGNLVYRPICSDAARLTDWSDVDTDGSRGAFGECIPGSEDTHIVDIPRTALLFATMCETGRVRVFGVDTSVAQHLKDEYRRLRDAGTISARAFNICMRAQASADDDGSWVWHFNHSHMSFCAEDCPGQKASLTERLRPEYDWRRRVSKPLPQRRASFTPDVIPREVEPR